MAWIQTAIERENARLEGIKAYAAAAQPFWEELYKQLSGDVLAFGNAFPGRAPNETSAQLPYGVIYNIDGRSVNVWIDCEKEAINWLDEGTPKSRELHIVNGEACPKWQLRNLIENISEEILGPFLFPELSRKQG